MHTQPIKAQLSKIRTEPIRIQDDRYPRGCTSFPLLVGIIPETKCSLEIPEHDILRITSSWSADPLAFHMRSCSYRRYIKKGFWGSLFLGFQAQIYLHTQPIKAQLSKIRTEPIRIQDDRYPRGCTSFPLLVGIITETKCRCAIP